MTPKTLSAQTILIILTCVLLIVGFQQKLLPYDAKNSEEVHIGVIATITGLGSHQGEHAIRGAKLAEQEINSNGGINGKKLSLILEDSKTDIGSATSAFTKIASLGTVQAIVGDSWTSTTSALVPLANEKQIILLGPLTTLNQLSQNDYFFRIMPKTADFMQPLANYTYEHLGSRKVAIIYQNSVFGVEHAEDFTKYFEALGGTVVAKESFQLSETDFRSQLLRMESAAPDTILNLHGSTHIGLVIQQAKELNVQVNWLASWGAENSELVEEYGTLVENLIYPYPKTSIEDTNFTKAYKNQYHESPDITAIFFYDSVKLIAQALSKGDSTEGMKKFLLSHNTFKGAGGDYSFDNNGDITRQVSIKQIRNGNFFEIQ